MSPWRSRRGRCSVASAATTVNVTPSTTLTVTPHTSVSLSAPPINTEPIAAALLRSSENQAASTMALAAALKPAREAAMPGGATPANKTMDLALLALIVFLILK